MPETQPISWRSIVYGTPVTSSDNVRVGVVHEVLGSDPEDIFHGLRVALAGRRQDVMVSADDIASMSLVEVRTALTLSQIEGLPAYRHMARPFDYRIPAPWAARQVRACRLTTADVASQDGVRWLAQDAARIPSGPPAAATAGR